MSVEPPDPASQGEPQFTEEEKLLTQEDLRSLALSSRELTKELALDTLLQRILETASRLTDSPETSVILRNDRQPTLYFAAATGEEAEWVLSAFGVFSDKQVPIEGSKAGAVYLSGDSLVENAVKNHFSEVDNETQSITKSMICVPLHVGSDRLGVMQVLNKRSGDYTVRDRVILEFFADQASVAIRNAKLLESLLAHSGLYGRVKGNDDLFARMKEINQEARPETLSVLFADMRGFTQLCQSLPNPVLVQERLSDFISMLSQAVIDADGIVNKFLGDGVMALFQGETCSLRAVECAFSMVERFSAMKAKWDADSNQQLDYLDLGVGITTDQVILGGVGGRALRDYTAIGIAVNLAAAFEVEARNGKRILCDQRTLSNASSIISDFDSLDGFVLKKPGQEVGVRYKCYSLKGLQSDKKTTIFISHSHGDRDFVEALVEKLKQRGIATWNSVTDIPKGALWASEIPKAIAQCNWMAVIVSKHSADSKWVRREVALGVNAEHLEDRIIPVALDATPLSRVNDLLSTMQAIYDDACDDVAEQLAEHFSTKNPRK